LSAHTLRLESGVVLPNEGTLSLALDLHAPRELPERPIAFVCLPGGGMSRRYFDLTTEDDPDSFSFVKAMTAQGFIVVSIDYLGIGDSSRPQDGWALTPELIARANAHVTTQVLSRLRAGSFGLPALPELRSIGLGHSMGAMMTVLQQAAFRQHQAIALLGFSTRGLPEYAPAEVKAMDHEARRKNLAAIAKAQFKEAYPRIGRSRDSAELYASAKADPRAAEAIKPVMQPLLAQPATLSMFPGNVAPEAAQVEVPVLLGLGALDMAGPPHQAPTAFTASRDVTLAIFRDTGHSHFVFPTRMEVFSRIAAWARSVIID
jgi:pimeloyl-ACP methyl ester carboxylesterase